MQQLKPQKNLINTNTYVSYRRAWLDFCLESYSSEMRGVVLDLGGKRENKRGSFRPPEELAQAWWYVNREINTQPNIFGDLAQVPIKDECADIIICTEVLEHLADPVVCVEEIYRLLKSNGCAFVSVPFLYPVHADPYDFQRFTEDGLLRLFRKFSRIEIIPMGSYWGTLGMLLEIGIPGITGNRLHKKVLRRTMTWFARFLCTIDQTIPPNPGNLIWQKYTTGYFLKATK